MGSVSGVCRRELHAVVLLSGYIFGDCRKKEEFVTNVIEMNGSG